MILPLACFEEYKLTIPFRFHEHSLINSDIHYFIYFKARLEFLRIALFMTSLEGNTKAMYTPEMLIQLRRYIKSIGIITNFISKYSQKSRIPQRNANELSLDLTPFTGATIKITNQHNTYTFTIKNILKLYKHALLDIDSYYYLNYKLPKIKNPYTNEPFTLKQHLIIFKGITTFYLDINKMMPQFLMSFKMCYFDRRVYKERHSNILFYNSIKSFLQDLDKGRLEEEFKTMLAYSPFLNRYYCIRCFKGIDIRQYYMGSIGLYILNSNAIYCFGTFKKEFLYVTQALNIPHNINHRKQHRRFIARRTRVDMDRPPTPLLINHPLAF